MAADDISTRALRRTLGRGSVYTVGLGLQVAGGILVLPLLTRVLDPEVYGVVAVAIVVQVLLSIVATAGLPYSILRTYFLGDRGPDDARSLAAVTLVTAFIVVVFAELTGPLWSQMFVDIPYAGALRIATWSAIGLAGLRAAMSVLRSAERAGAFVVVVIISTVGAQLLGLLLAGSWGANGYLVGLAAGQGGALLVAMFLLRGGGIPRPSRALIRAALVVGLPVVLHGLAIYVMSAGDRVIVERLEGVPAAGRYYLAYVVGWVGIIAVGALNNAWTPIVFGTSQEARWKVLSDTASTIVWLSALLAGMLAVGAPIALAVLAPPEYDLDTLVPVTGLVAAATIPWAIYVAHQQPALWLGKTGALAVATPAAAALNVGLNVLLIPRLGLTGAAVATLLSYVLLAVLIAARTRVLVSIPWRDAQFLLAALAGGALVALGIVQPTSGIWIFARGLELCALVLGAAYVGARAAAVTRMPRLPAIKAAFSRSA